MLAEDGKLHADGKLILRDLFDKAGFYSPVQHFPGQHDLTVARAARRELVVHILALIEKSEDEIVGKKRTTAIPEHEDRDVAQTLELMEKVYDS